MHSDTGQRNRRALSEGIRALAADWIATGKATDIGDINAGGCQIFAEEIFDRLKAEGDPLFDEDGFRMVDLDDFLYSDDEDFFRLGRPFDRSVIARDWPLATPTEGLTWDDFDRLSADIGFGSGSHKWLTFEGRHYDAECPDGVDNPFELPFFREIIRDWMDSQASVPGAAR